MFFDFDERDIELLAGVVLKARPLEAWAFQKIMALLSETNNEDQNAGLKQLSNPKLLEVAEKVLPAHCSNLSGIEIKKGGVTKTAEITDLLSHGAFVDLLVIAISKLLEISTVDKTQATFLGEQSPNT